jgi:hypothetical protein
MFDIVAEYTSLGVIGPSLWGFLILVTASSSD